MKLVVPSVKLVPATSCAKSPESLVPLSLFIPEIAAMTIFCSSMAQYWASEDWMAASASSPESVMARCMEPQALFLDMRGALLLAAAMFRRVAEVAGVIAAHVRGRLAQGIPERILKHHPTSSQVGVQARIDNDRTGLNQRADVD